MPRTLVENNDRISLRVASDDKALLMRAAALLNSNLTEFVVGNAVLSARKVIEENNKLELTERDSMYVLDLLDNPPEPNKKLMKAAFALPK